MKTQLTLLALLFTLLVSAQEKHSISTFNTKYTKVPNYPITQIEGGTEYAIDVTLEFGKESKLKPQIEALELYNQKKTSKADLIFAITVKEPEALIEEKKKEDGTYFYTYEYSTTCLVEAKKGGKVVDTVPYKIKGEKIKTISAAPITIVDKYVKSPVFK